jgi:hypothetical protein
VQPGDYVELHGNGLMHRIMQVGVPNVAPLTVTTNTNYLVISPPLTYPITNQTTNYRIMRSPRVAGDEQLKMPDNVYIDAQTNLNYNSPLPPANVLNDGSGFFDILFAPNGAVISKGVSGSNLHLWIRAPSEDVPAEVFRGQPSIISVFVRTGFAGSYPVDPSGVNPYALVDK